MPNFNLTILVFLLSLLTGCSAFIKSKNSEQSSPNDPIDPTTVGSPIAEKTVSESSRDIAEDKAYAENLSKTKAVDKSASVTTAKVPPSTQKVESTSQALNKVDNESTNTAAQSSQKAPVLLPDAIKTEESAPQDIWKRVRQGFKLDLTQTNKRIDLQLKWYAKNQNYLNRTFKRAEPYLYYIVSEVEKRNLPMELALLPVVESAFDPFAYSHGRASGIWQFIPSTGKMYGMRQDWWYDGRRDIIASTNGALNYLTWLSGRFNGNWQHALASYNSGSGTVSKAIRKNKKRNKPTDFWSLKLPRETRAYVPKLIAISKLVENPAKYGVTLPPLENKPFFKIIKTGSQLDLAQAAKLAAIDIDALYKLNPGFNRWATSPLGPHRLVIPIENADLFESELSKLAKSQRVNWQRYTIKRGDSLIKIARKHQTTPQVIKEVNRLRNNRITAGKTLLIPVASKNLTQYTLSAGNRLNAKQNKYSGKANTAKIEYIVKKGDTFWDISRAYKVNHRKLAKWNGMAPTDPLRPGQKLVIWSKASNKQIAANAAVPNSRTMVRKINYRVRSGDSLARIANKFNVRIRDIVAWNSINPKSYLQPGQRLTLHVDIAAGH